MEPTIPSTNASTKEHDSPQNPQTPVAHTSIVIKSPSTEKSVSSRISRTPKKGQIQQPNSPSGPPTLSDLVASLRDSPKELWVIFALKFTESYAYFIMSYVLILFLSDEFHYSDIQAGWMYGVLGMLTSIYGLAMGLLIDRIGVKNALVTGMCLVLFSRAALSVVKSHAILIFILFTVFPLGKSLGIPVMQIGVKRYTNERNRPVAFSIFYMIMNLAEVFATPMIDIFRTYFSSGVTMNIMGRQTHLSMYGLIFFSAAITSAVSLFMASTLIRDFDAETGKPVKKAEISTRSIVRDVIKRREFWQFLCLVLLLIGIRMIVRHLDATFPKYMIRMFGKDVLYGTIIAINPILIIALVPVFTPLSYFLNPYTQILIGTLITALSPIFLCMGTSYLTAVLFVVVLSIGESLWSPRLYEYALSYCEKGREGTYMALAHTPMFVATLFSGVLSGWLVGYYIPVDGEKNPQVMWTIITLISLTSPVLMWLFRDKIEVHPKSSAETTEINKSEKCKYGILNDTCEEEGQKV